MSGRYILGIFYNIEPIFAVVSTFVLSFAYLELLTGSVVLN